MADNASDTATGQDGATPGGPTSDDKQQPQGGKRGGTGRAVGSGMRDMLLSMIVLAVGVLVFAAITRSCSFSPGGPSTDSSQLPTVDVTAELQAAAGQVKFELREPRPPTGWRANSDSVDQLGPNGEDQAVRIGWIATDGRYLQVSQSNASALDLVRSAAALGNNATVASTGSTTVSGVTWMIYPGVRDELSWVTDLGTERLFITGNGTTADFRTLATAALTGRKVKAAGS
jgi:hypothetical protein